MANKLELALAVALLLHAALASGALEGVATIEASAVAAAKACPSDCLTCDSSGGCTSCPSKFGLNAESPPRCVPCAGGWACMDCNDDFKICKKCAMDGFQYLTRNHTCEWCTGYDGPCDPKYGCDADGNCRKCGSGYDEYVRINGTCQSPQSGCKSTQTRQDGSCKKCDEGYVTVGGTCKQCPDYCEKCTAGGKCQRCTSGFGLVKGKCKACPENCAACDGDARVCQRCAVSMGGFSDDRKSCVPCKDKNCNDCTKDWRVCTNCMSNYAVRGGKCVACLGACNWCGKPGPCSWGSGQQYPLTCSKDLVCNMCDYGSGRVGKRCEKCKMKGCMRCNGDASLCQECEGESVEGLGYASRYPAEGGKKCVRCKVEKCLECRDGPNGPCKQCGKGYGVVKGRCEKCKVDGCERCDGNTNLCKDCGGNDCDNYKWHEFDPRTKQCVTFDGIIDC